MPFDVHCFERLVNGLADLGRCVLVIRFGPFCMAHSWVVAGEGCLMRQEGNQSKRHLRGTRSGEVVPEKALTTAGSAHPSGRYLPITRDIYEPIVHQLGVWGKIVKHGRMSRCRRPVASSISTMLRAGVLGSVVELQP